MPPCQGGCREFEPRLPLHKKALDFSLKAFLLCVDCGLMSLLRVEDFGKSEVSAEFAIKVCENIKLSAGLMSKLFRQV